MISELPAPLTPPECDTRGLEWMPLLGDRLFSSQTWLLACDEARCAMLKLWWASWKQYPAASLPDDDTCHARLAGYERATKAWTKIRAQAMRGWVKCSDGFLYHPVVADLAVKAMGKREGRVESENAKTERQRRWRERLKDICERLRGLGVTPPRGASMETLNNLLVDAESSTHAPTDKPKASTVGECKDVVETGSTLQDTTEKKETSLRDEKKNRKTQVPEDWQPDAEGVAYAKDRGLTPADLEAFRDHYRSQAKPMADWNLTWKNWCRNARKFGAALPSLPGLGASNGRVSV